MLEAHWRMAAEPRLIRFFWPRVRHHAERGGSATPREVVDRAIEFLEISDKERAEGSGVTHVDPDPFAPFKA